MGNLVNCGFYRLHLAHAFLNGDAPVFQMVIALGAAGNVLKCDGNGGFLPKCFKESSVVLHAAGQFIHHDVGQLFSLGLGDIKDADHLKGGTHNLHCFGDGVSVCVQHGLLGLGIDLLHLHIRLVGRGGKDADAFLALHHMAVKVALPCRVPCNQGGFRLLHGDEQRVVEGVVIKLGHGAQIFLEPLGFKEFLDALFQPVCDLTDLLGVPVFCHSKPPIFCFQIESPG